MKRLEELRKQLKALLEKREAERNELLELSKLDDLNDEQDKRYRELATRFTIGDDKKARWVDDGKADELRSEIKALEAVVTGFARGDVEEPPAPPADFQHQKRQDHFAEGIEFRAVADVRAAARTMIEKIEHVEDFQRAAMQRTLDRTRDKTGALARHMIAAARPEYRSAFPKLLAGLEYTLTDDEKRAVQAVRAVTLTDANGGHVVPTVIDPTIILTGVHNGMLGTNPIRARADVRQITGDNLTLIKSGGVVVEWVTEGQESSDNSPTFSPIVLTPHRGNCFVPYTIEIEQDWPGLESELGKMIRIAKDDDEMLRFALGDGIGKPLGLITDLVTNYSGQVLNSAGADTFAIADVYALRRKPAPRYRARGTFMAEESIYDRVRQFDTAGGANYWTDLNSDRPSMLIGKPAIENPEMDGTYGSGENYVMVFGDFEGYTIVDRIGMTIERIPHLFGGSNNFPNGMRGLWAYWRTGARVTNAEALAVLNVT